MIPLRIRLAGFMSYRDEAELSFDGASLWVLSGGNGAGKSTVFDGITFALYGVHRAGKSNTKALINHQADRLLVEFDFANGQDIYRVKRTLSRRGQPRRQAFYLAGPNPPRPGQALPQSVPETDTDVGFKR